MRQWSWIIAIIKSWYCFYSPLWFRPYTAGQHKPIELFNLSKLLLQPAEAELWDVGPWIITRSIPHITCAVAWCITFHFSVRGAKMQTSWKEAGNLSKIASGHALAVAFCVAPRVTKDAETSRGQRTQHATFWVAVFFLIGLIRQRIYKACYLNAIFFYQNDNTIHKYSCLSSTDQSSSCVQSCTWRVSQTTEFHILVIILSVIDRNKPCNIHL